MDSEAVIAVVEVDDQQGGLAEETYDGVIAVDAELAVDVKHCWTEGGEGCWIAEGPC